MSKCLINKWKVGNNIYINQVPDEDLSILGTGQDVLIGAAYHTIHLVLGVHVTAVSV